MEKRQQQRVVEGSTTQAYHVRPQRETGRIQWTAVLCVAVLGLLIIGSVILGIMSLADLVHRHPGETWQHLMTWLQANLWWLIGGPLVVLIVFKVVMPTVEVHVHTAVPRAEAARIREETRRARDIRRHNREAMPQVYIALPDERGNYGQAFTGGYLLPGNTQSGNAGLNKQLLDLLAQQNAADDGEELLQIEGPESIDPRTVEAPTLEEDVQDGRICPGSPVTMGYRLIMDEFTGIWSVEPIIDPDDASMFICAASTAGKSTLVASMMARMAARGDTVFVVIDPHKNNPDRSIMAKVMPALDPWLAYPVAFGKDAKEVAGAVKFLKDLIALRQGPNTAAKQRHPLNGLKVRVIIDEALAMAAITRREKHDKAYDELLQVMQEMAIETAKDEIVYIAMAQLATKAQMGDIDIRDVCPKTIILKTPKQSGLALNLTGEQATLAHFFKKGRGFYIGDADEPEIFVWGNASASGIAQVAALAVSPLKTDRKPDEKQIVQLRVLPHSEEPFLDHFQEDKTDRNQFENQFPLALRADLDRIPDWDVKLPQLEGMIGQEMGLVLRTIWNATPGPGDKYKVARAEYDVLSEVIRIKLQMRREA